MRTSSLITTCLSLLPSLVHSYANPQGCSGDCFTHDPSLVKRSDGKYFRYSSKNGIPISTATNLAGPWDKVGYVVNVPSVINHDGNSNLWAPDVYKINSNYYCFYAVSTAGSHDSVIGYATSPTMDPGSWTDQHALVSSNNNTPWNAIDPNFSVDANNNLRLQWGSYWENIWIADLSVGSDAASASVADNEKQVAYDPAGNHQVEGAFLFNNGQYWYQFLSVGDCCTYDPLPPAGEEYRIVACRSSSPTGPFVDAEGKSCTQGGGTTVLASHGNVYAPGGQGVLRDPAHGDVLYYHYLDPTVGVAYDQSKFGWNVINWESGWPTV